MNREETVVREINANYTQSEDRAVGGVLTITSDAIEFAPNKVDELTGGTEVRIPVEEIESVGVEEKFSNGLTDALRGGGLRDRLRIERTDGRQELFVVSDLDGVIHDIRTVVDGEVADVSESEGDPELGGLLLSGVAYLLGGVALLLGVLYLLSADVAVSVLLLLAGVLGVPYTRGRLAGVLGVRISKWTASILFILCWLAASQLLA
ncbi:hypothetical protein [Halosimplex halobium]|uniref:hypothetical protein n=1 Tax=Halosimplex halobium TaxID=3396618 RepID=UPI003F56E431